MEERATDKLARYIMIAAAVAIAATVCWYFKNVIIYILAAVVVSLVARPLMNLLQKIRIKGRKLPDWLSASVTLLVLMFLFMAVITLIIPIVSGILKGISLTSIENAFRHIAVPLAELNGWLRTTFPQLGEGFRIEIAIVQEMQNLFDVSIFSSVIGSAASFISSFGVGLFAVVFISFFFIKNESLFSDIVAALVPDRHEKTAVTAISDIGYLLSRYFTGVLIEMTGVTLLNFLGLFFIARLGFNAAMGIAFLTGILNIIPYVGPLAGGVLGTILSLVLRYSSAAIIAPGLSFLWFTVIIIAIFCFTQLIDNILYQPVIYSTSIKAKPLEIFIVLLIAGHIGGPVGMLIAIPSYTAVRVIAFRFFRHIKAIRRLIPDEKLISSEKNG